MVALGGPERPCMAPCELLGTLGVLGYLLGYLSSLEDTQRGNHSLTNVGYLMGVYGPLRLPSVCLRIDHSLVSWSYSA